MVGLSHNRSTRSQVTLTVDPVVDHTGEPWERLPSRTVICSTVISVVVHTVVFLLLGLIVFTQKQLLPPLVSHVRFEDFTVDEPGLVESSDLELPEIETGPLYFSELVSSTAGDVARTTSEPNVDLKGFASESDRSARDGLPGGLAEITSGIQNRVSRAGGRKGEVQFSLAWHTFNDLDLHVIAPSGEHISYSHRTSNCKGVLDVDMNATATNEARAEEFSDEPVENVRWLDRNAPSGRFTVIVNQFRWRNGQSQDRFQLLAILGEKSELVEQVMMAQHPVSIHRFQYIRSSLSPGRREKLAAELTATQAREEAEATAILDRGLVMAQGLDRDRVMNSIISRFPHTDASIRAMQELAPPAKSGN